MTKKLFNNNAYETQFIAHIIAVLEKDDRYLIQLNETYFYPEGGGQPNDTGTIDGIEIYDVQYIDDEIYHYSKSKPSQLKQVYCTIDWERRFDLMQQHSGQHILSAACEKLYDANTVGFHLSQETVTIDLDKKLTADDLVKIEKLSNDIIFKNIPILVHYPDSDELSKLPLRKLPKVTKDIRIIEVENFDFSPCGGTHTQSTGEIGLLKIKKMENHKNGVRLEFICGNRALTDYQFKNDLIYMFSTDFSVPPKELESAYEKQQLEMKELKSELKNLKEQLILFKIKELKENAIVKSSVKIIQCTFDDIDMKTLKQISSTITNEPGHIALLSLVTDDVKLLFSSSKDISISMKDLIQEPLALIEGRGGGSPMSAQGGGPKTENAEKAISIAYEKIESLL